MIPAKPRVKEPVVWSLAAQDLLYYASHEAKESMMEQALGYEPKGMEWFTASGDLSRRIESDPATLAEYYGRTCFFIDRRLPVSTGKDPIEWSTNGPSVDRAHAKLWLWLNCFVDGYKI